MKCGQFACLSQIEVSLPADQTIHGEGQLRTYDKSSCTCERSPNKNKVITKRQTQDVQNKTGLYILNIEIVYNNLNYTQYGEKDYNPKNMRL